MVVQRLDSWRSPPRLVKLSTRSFSSQIDIAHSLIDSHRLMSFITKSEFDNFLNYFFYQQRNKRNTFDHDGSLTNEKLFFFLQLINTISSISTLIVIICAAIAFFCCNGHRRRGRPNSLPPRERRQRLRRRYYPQEHREPHRRIPEHHTLATGAESGETWDTSQELEFPAPPPSEQIQPIYSNLRAEQPQHRTDQSQYRTEQPQYRPSDET